MKIYINEFKVVGIVRKVDSRAIISRENWYLMKKGSNLIKSTVIIMIVSVISRALGLIRDMLIGKNFGAGMYTDRKSTRLNSSHT